MSDYGERLESLQHLAERATEVLSDFDDQAWPSPDVHQQIEAIVVYARLVLQATDAELVSPDVGQRLANRLNEWIDTPTSVIEPEVLDPWRNQILEALGQQPAGRGRDAEQQMKRAAATFQRSAQQRFNAVNRQTEKVRTEVEGLAASLVENRAGLEALVEQIRQQQDQATEERLSALDARSQEIQATVERHAQSIEALSIEQGEAFRKVQDERAEEHREREQKFETQMSELETQWRERVDALVADIDGMKIRSAELVGAIGVTGTAERYGEEFTEQRDVANKWRLTTVVLGVLAVAVSVLAAFDHEATTAGAKVAIAILLGGVAAYTARQSSRHRRREEHARQLQLDLTAFPVFVEALPREVRDEVNGLDGRTQFSRGYARRRGRRRAWPERSEPATPAPAQERRGGTS
jgi:hypothetical protein